MNDTDPMIQKMLDERYQKMTGDERLKIGFSMYDTARAIVLSSLPQDLSSEDRGSYTGAVFLAYLWISIVYRSNSVFLE